jgi:dTDP-4-dehydrorhamnose 3,5-epimerase
VITSDSRWQLEMLKFERTPFHGLIHVQEEEHLDLRGSFTKLFEDNLVSPYINQLEAKQVNLSKNTTSGTVRGFHFQTGQQREFKIVKCIRGSIFDILLDVRRDSETYGQCLSFILTEHESSSLIIPPGVAHAFQTLENNSHVHYVHTANYSPENSRGFNPLDASLKVDWPLPVSVISPRDLALPPFRKENS